MSGGKLAILCNILQKGADIGCVGRGRLPTKSCNRNVVWQADTGHIVTDMLQDWVVKGIAAGPLIQEEVEESFGQAFIVNRLTTRSKPNGALRLIVDMSSEAVPPVISAEGGERETL